MSIKPPVKSFVNNASQISEQEIKKMANFFFEIPLDEICDPDMRICRTDCVETWGDGEVGRAQSVRWFSITFKEELIKFILDQKEFFVGITD